MSKQLEVISKASSPRGVMWFELCLRDIDDRSGWATQVESDLYDTTESLLEPRAETSICFYGSQP